jgi:hypothetical protein
MKDVGEPVPVTQKVAQIPLFNNLGHAAPTVRMHTSGVL